MVFFFYISCWLIKNQVFHFIYFYRKRKRSRSRERRRSRSDDRKRRRSRSRDRRRSRSRERKSRKDERKAANKEEVEENKPKRVPVSLEEVLAKKKAEEEAQSKVGTFELSVMFFVIFLQSTYRWFFLS